MHPAAGVGSRRSTGWAGDAGVPGRIRQVAFDVSRGTPADGKHNLALYRCDAQ